MQASIPEANGYKQPYYHGLLSTKTKYPMTNCSTIQNCGKNANTLVLPLLPK